LPRHTASCIQTCARSGIRDPKCTCTCDHILIEWFFLQSLSRKLESWQDLLVALWRAGKLKECQDFINYITPVLEQGRRLNFYKDYYAKN